MQAVLLDPSCSGSGTVHSRMDFLLPSQWQAGGAAANEVCRLSSAARQAAAKLFPGKAVCSCSASLLGDRHFEDCCG